MLLPVFSHHERNEYRNSPDLHLAVKTDACWVCGKPSFSGKNWDYTVMNINYPVLKKNS